MKIIQSLFFFNDDKKGHIKSLDGLRGIAVILVLLSHSSFHHIYVHPALAFNGIGKGGVYLFYVLSAFLLDRQIVLALRTEKADSFFWKRYFLRRVFRIYPLFIFSLVVFLLLSVRGIPTVIQSVKDVLEHLFLMEGREIFWSVPVEFKYYFLSPLILLVCQYLMKWDLKKILLFFLSMVIITLALDYYFHFNRISTLKYITIFLVGTFLAVYNLKFSDSFFPSKWHKWISLAGISALLFCFVMNPNYLGNWLGIDTSNNGRKVMMLYALLCGILLFAALYSKGAFKKLLEIRFLRFTGAISYSLYLLHMPVIYLMESGIIYIPESLKIYFFMGATFLVSTLTFLFIERPMSRINIFSSPFILRESK